MRVIAGALKGRRLKAPTWEGLRPTSDRLRETLFNVIAPNIAGALVLDGYAGTGAIGIEALSRGARGVTFVEQDPRAVALIASNLASCGLSDAYTIVRAPFEAAAASLPAGPNFTPFDIVLLDPPYRTSRAEAPTHILEAASRLVGPHAILVLEHGRRDAVPAAAGALVRTRLLESGDSALSFYTPRP